MEFNSCETTTQAECKEFNQKFSVGYFIYSVAVTWGTAAALEKIQYKVCNGSKCSSLKNTRQTFPCCQRTLAPSKTRVPDLFPVAKQLLYLTKDHHLCAVCER